MNSSPVKPLLVFGFTLIYLLQAGSLYAQIHSLKLCSETFQKARQAVSDSRRANQSASFTLFSPAAQTLQQSYQDWSDCMKGQKAPLSSFKTLTGETYDTTSLAGKVLVINFWFMGCAPCVAEMPALNKLVEEYKGKNVLFLGFSMDKADRLTPAFFEKSPFNFKIVADARGLARSFCVMGNPTTYVVDQQGIIRQAWMGFSDTGVSKLDPYYKAKVTIDNLLGADGK